MALLEIQTCNFCGTYNVLSFNLYIIFHFLFSLLMFNTNCYNKNLFMTTEHGNLEYIKYMYMYMSMSI